MFVKVSVAALVLVIHSRCIYVHHSPAHWIGNQKSGLVDLMAVKKQNLYRVATIKVYGNQVHVGVFMFVFVFTNAPLGLTRHAICPKSSSMEV